MRTLLVCLAFTASLAFAQETAPGGSAAPDGAEQAPLARSRALELAGAFANDGYKVRDGFWSGTLEKGKPVFLEVNVFSGNDYWFSAAASAPARKISVAVFDETGAPTGGETFEDGAVAAAGAVPSTSGPLILRVLMTEGEKADFCLVYSYK